MSIFPAVRYFTYTAPSDGGFIVVLGDERESDHGYAYMNATDAHGKPYNCSYRSHWRPTERISMRVQAGDVISIWVTSYDPDARPLRWCLTTDVIWDPWFDSSYIPVAAYGVEGAVRPWTSGFISGLPSIAVRGMVSTSGASSHTFTGQVIGGDASHFVELKTTTDAGGSHNLASYGGGAGYSGNMTNSPTGFDWYSDTSINLSFGAWEWTVPPLAPGAFNPYYPVLQRGGPTFNPPWDNGLVGGEAELRGRAIEWADGVGAPSLNLYRTLSMSWSRYLPGIFFWGSPQPLYDAMDLELRDASGTTLDALAASWQSPGALASLPMIHDQPAPADGSMSGSWTEAPYPNWFYLTPLIENITSEQKLTYLFDTSNYAEGVPINGEYIRTHPSGIFGVTITDWSLTGQCNVGMTLGLVWPDYRLGTYVEHLPPVPPLTGWVVGQLGVGVGQGEGPWTYHGSS